MSKILSECFNAKCARPPVRNARGSKAQFAPSNRCLLCGRFGRVVR